MSFLGKRAVVSTVAVAFAGFALFLPSAQARKHPNPKVEEDAIAAVGHLPLKGDTAARLLTAEHWRRDYIYIELSSRPVLLQVDVTDVSKPKLVNEFALPAGPETHVETVVGSAVMITGGETASAPTHLPRSVQLLSFQDPGHPRTLREFSNLTGFLNDGRRSLVYLFNDAGLWILQQKPATDQELERQYEHEVLYNR